MPYLSDLRRWRRLNKSRPAIGEQVVIDHAESEPAEVIAHYGQYHFQVKDASGLVWYLREDDLKYADEPTLSRKPKPYASEG